MSMFIHKRTATEAYFDNKIERENENEEENTKYTSTSSEIDRDAN